MTDYLPEADGRGQILFEQGQILYYISLLHLLPSSLYYYYRTEDPNLPPLYMFPNDNLSSASTVFRCVLLQSCFHTWVFLNSDSLRNVTLQYTYVCFKPDLEIQLYLLFYSLFPSSGMDGTQGPIVVLYNLRTLGLASTKSYLQFI